MPLTPEALAVAVLSLWIVTGLVACRIYAERGIATKRRILDNLEADRANWAAYPPLPATTPVSLDAPETTS